MEQNKLIAQASLLIADIVANIVVARSLTQALDSGLRAELAIAKAMGSTSALTGIAAVMDAVREIKDLQKSVTASADLLGETICSLVEMDGSLGDLYPVLVATLSDVDASKKEFLSTLETAECHLKAQMV